MELRKVSAKELIRPIEDPSKSYPFNPKPINNSYSDFSKISRFSYNSQNNKNPSLYGISRNLGYDGAKPFSGSYEESSGSKGSNYAFSSQKSNSESYSMAA